MVLMDKKGEVATRLSAYSLPGFGSGVLLPPPSSLCHQFSLSDEVILLLFASFPPCTEIETKVLA